MWNVVQYGLIVVTSESDYFKWIQNKFVCSAVKIFFNKLAPFLIPEVKYVSSDNDKIKNELSVLVNHLKALDINFKELDTAIQEKLLSDFQRYYYHNEETNDVLNVIGSVANDFLNSLMPWSNNYSVAVNLDVHAIDVNHWCNYYLLL